MPDEAKHAMDRAGMDRAGMDCAEFQAVLIEVIDGQLTAARQQSFDAHRRICTVCGPLFADVQAGQQWLKSLPEVDPPAHLVHNILIATSGVESKRATAARADGRKTPFGERVREWWDSMFAPAFAFVRQPRFAMSFGMIFFMGSLGLSLAGVKPADVAKVDLRPAALRHAYNDAQIKVVKYYDNIRFVYEIESRVRELKRASTPAEPAEQRKEDRKNDTSGQPEQKQDRNYSLEQGRTIMAAFSESPKMPPVVPVTTNRRFV